MAEYIKREVAIKSIEEVVSAMETWISDYQAQRRGLMTAITIVEDVPAADVAPVRHGRWLIKTVRGDKRTVCSECLLETGTCYEENYCPNCGARMDGDGV